MADPMDLHCSAAADLLDEIVRDFPPNGDEPVRREFVQAREALASGDPTQAAHRIVAALSGLPAGADVRTEALAEQAWDRIARQAQGEPPGFAESPAQQTLARDRGA